MQVFLKLILLALLLLFASNACSKELLDSTSALLATTSVNAEVLKNASNLHLDDFKTTLVLDAEDASNVPHKTPTEVSTLPSRIPDESQNKSSRTPRQLFYNHPNLLLVPGFGFEGGKCITARGIPGVCVRFNACSQYYRLTDTLGYLALRQWPRNNMELCSFYDLYGRANSGICCNLEATQNNYAFLPPWGGGGAIGSGLGPALVIPAPIPAPPAEIPEDDKDIVENHKEDNEDTAVDLPEKEDEEDEEEVIEAVEHEANRSPDFVDENNLDNEEDNKEEQKVPLVVTYDDYRYQWPQQFVGNPFSGVSQWPPPIPTHPPSTGRWPPPIPTHPPNHHYPTHPPSSSPGVTTRRPTSHAPVTTTKRTTTSRRPASTVTTKRPSYPQYPQYPPHRPLTTTTTLAPTTSRRPVSSPPSSSMGLPSQCGVKNPVSPDQERIVGGTNASPNEFPWIAVLFKSGKQFCGGSLITNQHILTAAHCVARMTSWDVAALTVHLGDYNIKTDFEVKHLERRIKRLVRHKGFEFSTLHNDIAILTLNEPVKYTYEIQPICLPISSAQQSRSYSGQVATVAGWGSLRENGPQPSILQKVQIPVWTNSECARKYGRAAPAGIIESMICAGQASKDSCSGDSGGPLIINEGGRYTQVGIVSWGIGCGKGQYPGVYTRITSLLPWIYKNIK